MPSLARSKGSAWVMFPPLNQMRPEFRPDAADQKLEERALARAIGTDDAAHLAGIDRPRNVVDGTDPAERFAEILDHQKHRPN